MLAMHLFIQNNYRINTPHCLNYRESQMNIRVRVIKHMIRVMPKRSLCHMSNKPAHPRSLIQVNEIIFYI